MQKIYTVFLYKQRNGKCVDEIIEQLEKMKVVAQTNDNFAFQLCYFHCINRYADIKNDMNLFLSNTNKALAFFNSSKTPLPYTTKWLFLINLVPIYINRKEYTRAEQSLSACLELPKKGTFNWHLTLIYKALYGFRTNKPAIALNAWQTAHSTSFKFKSSLIEDQWKIIEAYLALFRNNGRIHYNDKFSIYKLNTTKASKDNKDRKANLLVLELLHLLSTQKLKSFTKKTWEIEGIIKREFNTQKYRRTKYFLRSIRAIVDGNITPTGAARHAVIPLEKMRAISSPLNSNNVESEIVPYEILWDLVMDTLRRGG
jgi:tetratricopeptide (TPR) repeat protein